MRFGSTQLEGYTSVSREKGLPPRCPYAAVDRCPRYFPSLALMPATGGTAMDPDQEKRLLAKWNCSGLWPAVAEQETSVTGVPGDAHILNHFCPEVMYLRFGIFASDSARYADELDAEFAHKGLAREGASSYDPRWHWAYAREIHFSECDLYSPLLHGASDPGKAFVGEEVLELKPGAFGFSLNLKALWKKARMWYERRQGGA